MTNNKVVVNQILSEWRDENWSVWTADIMKIVEADNTLSFIRIGFTIPADLRNGWERERMRERGVRLRERGVSCVILNTYRSSLRREHWKRTRKESFRMDFKPEDIFMQTAMPCENLSKEEVIRVEKKTLPLTRRMKKWVVEPVSEDSDAYCHMV